MYNSGVQRQAVQSFLVALASRSPVVELDSPVDWRREAQRGLALDPAQDRAPGAFGEVEAWQRWGSRAKGWFVAGEEREFDEAVKRIVGEEPPVEKRIKVYGRDVVAPWVVGGVAKFTFKELCEAPLGPADFTTISATFVSRASQCSAPLFLSCQTRKADLGPRSLATRAAHAHPDRRPRPPAQRQERGAPADHPP